MVVNFSDTSALTLFYHCDALGLSNPFPRPCRVVAVTLLPSGPIKMLPPAKDSRPDTLLHPSLFTVSSQPLELREFGGDKERVQIRGQLRSYRRGGDMTQIQGMGICTGERFYLKFLANGLYLPRCSYPRQAFSSTNYIARTKI